MIPVNSSISLKRLFFFLFFFFGFLLVKKWKQSPNYQSYMFGCLRSGSDEVGLQEGQCLNLHNILLEGDSLYTFRWVFGLCNPPRTFADVVEVFDLGKPLEDLSTR